jgi:hypothetical protein
MRYGLLIAVFVIVMQLLVVSLILYGLAIRSDALVLTATAGGVISLIFANIVPTILFFRDRPK